MHIVDDNSHSRLLNTLTACGLGDVNLLYGRIFEVVKATATLITIGREIEGQFPDYKAVIPAVNKPLFSSLRFSPEAGGTHALFKLYRAGYPLNADFLKDMARCSDSGADWKFFPCAEPAAGKKTTESACVFSCLTDSFLKLSAVMMPMSIPDVRAKVVLSTIDRKEEPPAGEDGAAGGGHESVNKDAPAAETAADGGAENFIKEHVIITGVKLPDVKDEPPDEGGTKPRLSWKQIKALSPAERRAYAKEHGKGIREEGRQAVDSLLASGAGVAESRAMRVNALGPAASYASGLNFLTVLAADTIDARTYQAWKKAGRQVKKGAVAFYISTPWIPEGHCQQVKPKSAAPTPKSTV
jgi:hypothetical protein